MITFIICLCFSILLFLFSIFLFCFCVYYSVVDSIFYLAGFVVTVLICVFSIFCFFETIDLYNTRCPTCDVICLDEYCSTCGSCINPSLECSCGSSYDLDSLPNFCSECGSSLK